MTLTEFHSTVATLAVSPGQRPACPVNQRRQYPVVVYNGDLAASDRPRCQSVQVDGGCRSEVCLCGWGWGIGGGGGGSRWW
jgi:hypothetical protein